MKIISLADKIISDLKVTVLEKGWAVGEFKICFTRIYSPMNGKPNILIFYRRIIILKALCRA